MKKLNWPLGPIIGIYPDLDNTSRVAEMKVVNGELLRTFLENLPVRNSYGRSIKH